MSYSPEKKHIGMLLKCIDKTLELGPKKIEHKLTQRLSVEERDELERLLLLVLKGLEN